MIKISVGIHMSKIGPHQVFGFWAKSALKRHCTKIFLTQKLLLTIRNFWRKDFFDRPKGVASVLMA